MMRSTIRNVPQHFYELIPDWPARSHREHAQLLHALREHDGATARAVAEQHVMAGGSMLVQFLESSGFWLASEAR
jgi:DNA-binding GntR family transcriptional regulator